MSTNPPPTENEVLSAPPPQELSSEDEWSQNRREVYLLPNGSTLVARNEIEAGAYANKGGKLVDVIYDE